MMCPGIANYLLEVNPPVVENHCQSGLQEKFFLDWLTLLLCLSFLSLTRKIDFRRNVLKTERRPERWFIFILSFLLGADPVTLWRGVEIFTSTFDHIPYVIIMFYHLWLSSWKLHRIFFFPFVSQPQHIFNTLSSFLFDYRDSLHSTFERIDTNLGRV